jgi:preprotein translocase subunit SecD
LDDRLISAPVFSHGPITAAAGGAVIENVTAAEATRYAIQLNSGALPVPLKETGDRRDIDPALGPQFIKQSLIAGAIGLGLVILFMFLFYRLLGLLAGGALLIYGCLVLSIFKLIPVTLTLAGLGGFILSIGMAVDANVLIFERLKEELRAGRTLGAAVEAGFARAWPAIRDSNVTTFIVCAILYWLGNWTTSPPVQGFALTLFIGVATSMFTAVFVTRNFLHLATGWRWLQRRWLYVWLREGRGV